MAPELDADILEYYDRGDEQDRLTAANRLELLRTQELLERCLPPAPAADPRRRWRPGRVRRVADRAWLRRRAHRPRAAPRRAGPAPAAVRTRGSATPARSTGPTARRTPSLLMGPLYHLVDRDERLQAWREAARVVRPGGVVGRRADLAVRRADRRGRPRASPSTRCSDAVAHRCAATGVLAPTKGVGFTTAYFHHPDEIADEVADAGLELDAVYGIEGPGEWMADLDARLDDRPAASAARPGPDDRDRADRAGRQRPPAGGRPTGVTATRLGGRPAPGRRPWGRPRPARRS